jgi:hypothetical protein
MVREILRTADVEPGVEAIEPGLEEILDLLRSHQELRSRFESEIIGLLDSIEEGVIEIVSFAMHDLRWERIEREIRRRLMGPETQVSWRRHYEAMIGAFSDDWRDRDLYRRYSGEGE